MSNTFLQAKQDGKFIADSLMVLVIYFSSPKYTCFSSGLMVVRALKINSFDPSNSSGAQGNRVLRHSSDFSFNSRCKPFFQFNFNFSLSNCNFMGIY